MISLYRLPPRSKTPMSSSSNPVDRKDHVSSTRGRQRRKVIPVTSTSPVRCPPDTRAPTNWEPSDSLDAVHERTSTTSERVNRKPHRERNREPKPTRTRRSAVPSPSGVHQPARGRCTPGRSVPIQRTKGMDRKTPEARYITRVTAKTRLTACGPLSSYRIIATSCEVRDDRPEVELHTKTSNARDRK